MIFIKALLLTCFLSVFVQDWRERKVFWFLFPIIAICCGVLLYNKLYKSTFYITILINSLFNLMLLLIIAIYSKFKLKTSMKNTFGMGDALLFFALAFSFSCVSYLILFVFGLVFSLTLHLFLKHKNKQDNVPLAGYLSLFFSLAYLGHWIGFLPYLYTT